MKSTIKERPVTTDPCRACGKATSERHGAWCGKPMPKRERRVYERVLSGVTDRVCSGCLAIVLGTGDCPRCPALESERKAKAAAFFEERAKRKAQEKIEAQLLADEATDLI
jgi:hypothetical protein